MKNIFNLCYLALFVGISFADDKLPSKLSVRSIDSNSNINSNENEIKTNSCKYLMRPISTIFVEKNEFFFYFVSLWMLSISERPQTITNVNISTNMEINKRKKWLFTLYFVTMK